MKKLTRLKNLTGYCFKVAGTVLLGALSVTIYSLRRSKLQKKGEPRLTKKDWERFRKEHKK